MPMVLADPDQPDCPVVFCNDAYCASTGFSREEVLGRNCRYLQGPGTDPEAVARMHDAVRARQPFQEEIYNYRKDGSGFWNLLFMTPVKVGNGEREYLFASQHDVTSRKEADFRQLRRAESLGALASGIAHEVNNLMTVVLGSVERALKWANDHPQRELLERADWAARKAGSLASNLLSVARQRADAAEIADLNLLVSGSSGAMRQIVATGVEIVLELAHDAVFARLDVDQLELVLLNLARNASDAMPKGGTIVVATRTVPAAPDSEASVVIAVSDAGGGMPPEVAERATEAFFTTKRDKGTGLGLFLAIGFVEQWGGRLGITTSPGQGTTVELSFPRATSR
jgi:PAS domain S-box-containing protein